uniref:RING-type domain-containing protein n=1 Tax=Periophthalmus magnuspinnatus TaxID=409849 RepID=A0A3B4B3N4_9GOBI
MDLASALERHFFFSNCHVSICCCKGVGKLSFADNEPEKCFDHLENMVPLVDGKDDLDPFSLDDGVLKARLSCGHVVSPESLTAACRAQLDEGNYKFKCPALIGERPCNSPLSYQEVRRLADLTVKEMQYFEENIARLAAADYSDIQRCPKCKTNIERKDMANLCVQCSVCSAERREPYLLCWQCLKPWKGNAPRSDHCENSGLQRWRGPPTDLHPSVAQDVRPFSVPLPNTMTNIQLQYVTAIFNYRVCCLFYSSTVSVFHCYIVFM